MGKNVRSLSTAARASLEHYDWPGNVRELENIIQRHVALCQSERIDEIQCFRGASSVPTTRESSEVSSDTSQLIPETGIDLEELLEDFERRHLKEAIRMTGGNLTNAAKLLGMSYRSIRYRVKKLGLKENARA